MTMDELPVTAHLEELRQRLIICVGSWMAAFALCYAVSERLFQLIAEPVQAALPEGSSLVFINATEPFFTYLKVAALSGLLLALPVLLWQLWLFVAPGMYGHEKRFALPFVLASCICFATGTWFGFRYVFPLVFRFLVTFGTDSGMEAMLSMGAYLALSSKLLLAFGLVFELPIIIFFLARMGIVDHHWLGRHRKYAILLAFVVGAILTPPDIISQLSLAGPFMILYEVGILAARLFGTPARPKDD
ncbi:twin arginine-targeting protein translocase TatC [Syntrophotalea acetylenivorans]|uniref:Sec-independent protein translocase protein TatC n=1 Tax=Syntrophotalea acetylenivorans TaxID=1842532 RepID=A0A1L3GQD4_9BACT|nr:twin-arginine translocase subunit TatC [Syntrophotalea acetylenivorans]APG28166.1 twin arginine-targeting protein translocase TatC [Syntrophotalea acetylenivorans]